MVTALAAALEVEPECSWRSRPSRQAELEIEVEKIQQEPLYQSLGLPYLKPGVRVPDDAADPSRGAPTGRSRRRSGPPRNPGGSEGRRGDDARRRKDLRHLVDVEIVAAKALAFAGTGAAASTSSPGPGGRVWLRGQARLRFAPLGPFGRRPRQRPDLHPQRDALRTCAARSVVLQTLGHVALNHDALRLRRFPQAADGCSYFAAAASSPRARSSLPR